jgi:organic hydroperoxide reductase OsmC/OhrA
MRLRDLLPFVQPQAPKKPPAGPGKGEGWKRTLIAFAAAACYSIAVTYGSVEQTAYIAGIMEAIRGSGCHVPDPPPPPEPPSQ